MMKKGILISKGTLFSKKLLLKEISQIRLRKKIKILRLKGNRFRGRSVGSFPCRRRLFRRVMSKLSSLGLRKEERRIRK